MPQSKALAVPLDKEEKPKKLKMMIAFCVFFDHLDGYDGGSGRDQGGNV